MSPYSQASNGTVSACRGNTTAAAVDVDPTRSVARPFDGSQTLQGSDAVDLVATFSADTPAAADLMKRAYPENDEARPFAPRGAPDEWIEYVTHLTAARGCGDLVEDACVSLPLGPDRLSGLALVTRIAPSTAHLAQLAIDPSMRGRGLGSALLLAACSGAHYCGYRRMTIVVSGKNAVARRLYEGAGFEVVTSFIGAGSSHPLRLSSVAGLGVAANRR